VTAPELHAAIHHDEEVELQMPLSGRITSSFGTRRDPIDSRQRQHRGLDIAAPRGTPIEAAAEGRVVFAGDQRGYGRTVIIEHADGRRTRYAHADELQVSAGDCVAAGQIIATVGSTGRATGPHLHFEVIEEGRQIDPLKILAKDFPLTGR
jgi:murein DD-endopeptidase MepM/ murein hydrolase activator NlpD